MTKWPLKGIFKTVIAYLSPLSVDEDKSEQIFFLEAKLKSYLIRIKEMEVCVRYKGMKDYGLVLVLCCLNADLWIRQESAISVQASAIKKNKKRWQLLWESKQFRIDCSQ